MHSRRIKAQSASEFLLTYGWAFLLTAIVVIGLYTFISAPPSITNNFCVTNSGPHCEDMLIGANSIAVQTAMLLTNSQTIPIYNPTLHLNASWVGTINQPCQPSLVLPGGAMLCSNTLITAPPINGILVSGSFIISYLPCPSANAVICSTARPQSYSGQFNTHVTASVANTLTSISLTAQNLSQSSQSDALDPVTATVTVLGFPLVGATVSFSSNTANAIVNPAITTADTSGNAITYVSGMYPGCVMITGNFANTNANVVVTFT